ncbi:hypothetical protein CKO42_24000 [Lamprobacter modestohalophilus]|uniref:Uncharacterized protein n=1 Tax=Lamprobacter modestohalophilus TaxID=1064514 RepID=A0A9X1B6B1_9GAMM|nr:hypothetical protein [Lamprobacter modestohalophilus]MBK1621420.1 hypothetical protein [Lamprobacter modestohalophilus]
MDSQTSSLDPGETLQAFLASLRDDFRRPLVDSLRRSLESDRLGGADAATVDTAFECVVDGAGQRR